MLILTRKLGETIRIGNEIKVTLLDVKGRQVRVGIDAPSEITIHREEIYRIIRDQNILAAEAGRDDLIGGSLPHVWKRLKNSKEDGA